MTIDELLELCRKSPGAEFSVKYESEDDIFKIKLLDRNINLAYTRIIPFRDIIDVPDIASEYGVLDLFRNCKSSDARVPDDGIKVLKQAVNSVYGLRGLRVNNDGIKVLKQAVNSVYGLRGLRVNNDNVNLEPINILPEDQKVIDSVNISTKYDMFKAINIDKLKDAVQGLRESKGIEARDKALAEVEALDTPRWIKEDAKEFINDIYLATSGLKEVGE